MTMIMAITATLLEDPAFIGSIFSMLILGAIIFAASVIIYILMKSR